MATTTLITSEQFAEMPDEFDACGNHIKEELIAGEIVRIPLATLGESLVQAEILKSLLGYFDSSPELALARIAYVVSAFDTLVPKVSVVEKSRLARPFEKYISGAPDLAIEIVSDSETAEHLKQKIDAYIHAGSRSVWVVYPDAKSIELHSPNGPTLEFKAGQTIEDPSLPGFSAPVASFFEIS